MTGIDALGFLAAGLVLGTFCMKRLIPLRTLAITSNVAFVLYGYSAGIEPVLILHVILLPINVFRLFQTLPVRVPDHSRQIWSDEKSGPTQKSVETTTRAACKPRLALVAANGAMMGEVLMRGNIVMKGYLKNPRATEEAFAGGWFRSGDLAIMHPDGYIELKDRSKDIIISGGENISTFEVEDVLYRHPCVLEAAVVARPDPMWGETPCAFVTLKPDADATADEIVAFCRDHLARFKVPRTVLFGPLPKTSTGKIQKFVLRKRAKETV